MLESSIQTSRRYKLKMRELEITNETDWVVPTELFETTLQNVMDEYQLAGSQISLVLIGDPAMHELNRRFLNHDYPTDVLTFPGVSADPQFLDGEIIISVDTAHRNAQEWGVTWMGEVHLYFVHGLLHLLGLDDHAPETRAEMRTAERRFSLAAGFEYRFSEDQYESEP